jgi:hypothetical protein
MMDTCNNILYWVVYPIYQSNTFSTLSILDTTIEFIIEKFQLRFENVVLESLKSYFKLDHEADIHLYLTLPL